MSFNKYIPVFAAVFLFPIMVTTVNHGGGAFYLLIFLLGLFLGWSAWRSLEAWEKQVLLGFCAFFVLVSMSLINTQDMYSGAKKIEKLLLFPFLIPMYLLFKKYQLETGKAYLLGLFVSAFVLFGLAVYQVYGLGWARAVGAYNPLILGDVSMLVAILLFCALLTVSTGYCNYLMGGQAILLAITASVLSGSRGAWIVLPIISLWFIWLKIKNLKPLYSLLIVIIVVSLLWCLSGLEQVRSRLDDAVLSYQSYSQDHSKGGSIRLRMEIWKVSVKIWKANPIIGTGLGDFQLDSVQLVKEGRSNLTEQQVLQHAHNIYFDVLATSGLVGLLALIVFVQIIPFLIFRSFWLKEQDPWIKFYALSGMATIIAFAVFGLTECWLARNPFVRTYLMSVLVFMSSIAVIRNSRILEARSSDK